MTSEVSKRTIKKPSTTRAEGGSDTQSTVNRNTECANDDETLSSFRANGAVVPPTVEETNDEFVMDADERRSHRQNVIALLGIFVASLVVMVLLFQNFPELDE